MAESWCKVSSTLDNHPKIRRSGRNGREVFLFALRRNSLPENPVPGMLPADVLDPWFIADQLLCTEAEAVEGLTRLAAVGLLVPEGNAYRIGGWDDEEWGRGSGDDRVNGRRKQGGLARAATGDRSSNGRFRPAPASSNPASPATDNAGVQLVPGGDQLPPAHQVRGEERRSEEKRREEKEPPSPLLGGTDTVGVKRQGRKPKPKLGEPTHAEMASARAVLSKLGERNGVAYEASKRHVALIVAQLRRGRTELELRAVIAYCADSLGWLDKPGMRMYLRPETLFGPETADRYLDPARAWAAREFPNQLGPKPQLEIGSDPAFAEPAWMGGSR